MADKEFQIEKKMIMEKTKLVWNRKQIFTFKYSSDFVNEFHNLKIELEKMNYNLKKIFHNEKKKIKFIFDSSKRTIWIYVSIPKDALFVELFTFLVDEFENNGYTGTNEWKRNFLKDFKIPREGDFKYLEPDGQYWFKDELCSIN